MGSVTPDALRAQIAAGDLAPLYLLLGEDEREKAELADALAATIDEDLRPFNTDRLDGGDVSASALLDAVRTLPMMAPRRVVVVVRAERMLQPRRESRESIRELEALESWLETPAPHATVVFVAGGLDERRRLVKRLLARAAVVRCGDLHDVADARDWIRARIEAAGKRAEPAAIRLLADTVGPDAGRLRREVDLLLLYTAHDDTVTAADVREVAGPTAAHDDWAVARAIEEGRAERALREVALALDAGAVPHVLLGQLAWVARTRLPGTRVQPAIEAVFRTDRALKTSVGEPRVLIERLVVQLCRAAASARPSAARYGDRAAAAEANRQYRRRAP